MFETYQRKPTRIEAVRLTPDNMLDVFHKMENAAAEWRHLEEHSGIVAIRIETLEGFQWAKWGDWIVKDEKGEFSTLWDKAFRATYEKEKVNA